jgi:hypothetical protein
MKRLKWTLAALAALASFACSSTESPRSDAPSGTPSPSVQILAASDCPVVPCQGPLEPGLYRSTFFDPTIDFEVTSSGWTWDYSSELVEGGNFRLIADEAHELPYGSDGIYFVVDPAIASHTCKETAEPGVGRSVDDLVAWLERAPGLVVSSPKPVTVGGLAGMRLDLELDPTWKKKCFFSEGLPVVPLLVRRAEIGAYHWVILPGVSMRWYILDSGDGVIIVDIDDGPDGLSHDDLLQESTAIVDSMVFSSPS